MVYSPSRLYRLILIRWTWQLRRRHSSTQPSACHSLLSGSTYSSSDFGALGCWLFDVLCWSVTRISVGTSSWFLVAFGYLQVQPFLRARFATLNVGKRFRLLLHIFQKVPLATMVPQIFSRIGLFITVLPIFCVCDFLSSSRIIQRTGLFTYNLARWSLFLRHFIFHLTTLSILLLLLLILIFFLGWLK